MSDENPFAFSLPDPSLDRRSLQSQAEWMYERVIRSINAFEEKLDQDHEVGASLVSFGSEMTFHIEGVGYWEPDMITFTGRVQDGKSVKLLQHISQLSVLLVALKKVHEEPRRIGFELLKSLKKDEE